MAKDNPLSRLHAKIEQEEQRTKQHALRVRISRTEALDLAGMDAADWHDASNGWTEMPQCRKLAGDFLRDGIAAAHGLRLSVADPVLEVALPHDAPDVEITEGIPY